MLKRFNITLALFTYSTFLFPQLQVKNYFSLTGKKDIPVNVMIQDFSGYLWLGTNDGVYKFDGRSATAVASENPVLKKEITALYIDSKETVWIGTKKGKVYFIRNNKVDSLVFLKDPNEEKITSFYESGQGLCIGTYGNGIYTLFKGQLNHLNTEKGLSDNVVYKITGNKNDIWCGTDAGITRIESIFEQARFQMISDKNGLPDNIVRDIVFEENRLLISMQDSGVCYYNLQKNAIERNPFFTNWALGTVLNAFTQHASRMVIGTEKNGLLQIDHGSLYVYNYQKYIQCPGINQLFIDREKQIWVASKKGISQFTERRYNFINASRGLSDDKILALAIDNDNAVWIGTSMGISRIMNDDEGKIVVSRIRDLDKYTISCATKAPDGNIWFGTYGYGIIVLSSETKNSIIFNSEKNQLSNDNISNIFFADKNTVYISTLGGGLVKAKVQLEEKEKKFEVEKIYTESEGLGSNYVYAAITDDHSNLYVATDGGGLQVLEKNSFTDLTKKHRLNSNTVFSLCKDKYNTIWATSNANGILKYDGKSLTYINQSGGLRDEQPQQLISTDNTVFAINSKGIDKINCKDNTVSYYDLYDGDLEPNLNAVFFSQNKIYSGTNNGVLTFRTNSEAADSIRPLVFIKSFFLNYKPFPLDSIYEFRHNQNNIAFAFDGIWLKNPGKLMFRYRLHGLEEEWLYSDEGKQVNYNNLNPGNYTFIVQVKNEEDIWSDPTGHSFIILMPIWKRWWFWVLIVSIGATTIYLFVRYRLKALQRENLLLERKVKERTSQIEKQAQIITQKNKDITDSISYARKIQHAILPADTLIKTHLPQSFVLYMTKDIVSGDFYWFTYFEDCCIIAAVDCTGHGVPGAFMSLIGYNLLNRIVNEERVTDPKNILVELNNGVLGVLHKNESESKDGMDIAICKINYKQNTLEYAGAMRPLWIVSKTANGPELTEIKADKIPIGTKQKDREQPISYTTHTLNINKDDTFYIFTDGYADQFGGNRDKKYSTGKFKELLISNSVFDFATQEKNIRQEHLDWKAENEQVDDILVIGFSVK